MRSLRLIVASLLVCSAVLVHASSSSTSTTTSPSMTFMCGYCGSAGPGLGIQIRCYNHNRHFELRQGCNDDCSNCTTIETHPYGAAVHNEHGSFIAGNDTIACEGITYLRYHNKTCNDYPLTVPKYRDSLQSGYCRSDFRFTCASSSSGGGGGVVVSNCTTNATLPYNDTSCFLVDKQNSQVQCLGSGYCFQIFQSP
ncbi:Hypothetical protein, putative [Bodo saltans]|uniref:Membrane-associated protein n=1 Tax=Bodo saltans TaxID=75058 RepID=A0A0S4J397_BODSA|nr:Hypothetical protein, putative [Bodo saltans]|eukprot:CUG66930.1 Hypothetical protein, putative [Bodo saltans]